MPYSHYLSGFSIRTQPSPVQQSDVMRADGSWVFSGVAVAAALFFLFDECNPRREASLAIFNSALSIIFLILDVDLLGRILLFIVWAAHQTAMILTGLCISQRFASIDENWYPA